MPQVKVATKDIIDSLNFFLKSTSELTDKAWKQLLIKISTTTVVNRMGFESFSHLVCNYASENAPDAKVYVWPICPNGKRHNLVDYFKGTRSQWSSDNCLKCSISEKHKQERLELQPTFATKYPHLVPFLVDSSNADSKDHMVRFMCSVCAKPDCPWSPSWGPVPTCSWCQARNGALPGETVKRLGGGAPVKLEKELHLELLTLGIDANSDLGIVTKQDTYIVPIIKPDIVIPNLKIVIELDNSPTSLYSLNRHSTKDGATDDKLRDLLLSDLNWKTLRIRRPDQEVDGSWPWRVETNSQSPRKLAKLVYEKII